MQYLILIIFTIQQIVKKQKDIDKFLQTNNIDTDKYYYSLPFNLKVPPFMETVYSIEKHILIPYYKLVKM